MKGDFRLTLELFHTTMIFNERIETWYSSANTRESYRIGTKKNPFDFIPLIALRSQNCFVPSKHLTD